MPFLFFFWEENEGGSEQMEFTSIIFETYPISQHHINCGVVRISYQHTASADMVATEWKKILCQYPLLFLLLHCDDFLLENYETNIKRK